MEFLPDAAMAAIETAADAAPVAPPVPEEPAPARYPPSSCDGFVRGVERACA